MLLLGIFTYNDALENSIQIHKVEVVFCLVINAVYIAEWSTHDSKRRHCVRTSKYSFISWVL